MGVDTCRAFSASLGKFDLHNPLSILENIEGFFRAPITVWVDKEIATRLGSGVRKMPSIITITEGVMFFLRFSTFGSNLPFLPKLLTYKPRCV